MFANVWLKMIARRTSAHPWRTFPWWSQWLLGPTPSLLWDLSIKYWDKLVFSQWEKKKKAVLENTVWKTPWLYFLEIIKYTGLECRFLLVLLVNSYFFFLFCSIICIINPPTNFEKSMHAKSLQSHFCSVVTLCPTLWDPMDCSPPGSFVHEILQARIMEWVAIPFSRESSRPRDWTCIF